MPWPASGGWTAQLCILLLALWTGWAVAAPANPGTIELHDSAATLDAETLGLVWFDPAGIAKIEQVAQAGGPARFEPMRDVTRDIGPNGRLWLHYRAIRPRTERMGWLLEFPMPFLDEATLYQQDEHGRWLAQSAGDTIAVDAWPEPGRYPSFRLDLPAGQPRDFYVRLRHTMPASFPIRLVSDSSHDQRAQHEYLGLGMVFGAMMLLVAGCLVQAGLYRDRSYAWYAAYLVVSSLAAAAYTGVAGHMLWPGFTGLGDAYQASLGFLAAGTGVLFVRSLVGVRSRFRWVDKAVAAVGLLGIVLCFLFPFLPKPVGLAMLGLYLLTSTPMNLAVAANGWRRGDHVGLWATVAYAPQTLFELVAVVRLFGFLPFNIATQYALVLTIAIQIPALLVALNLRARERHGAQIRELALSSQDALTGLLAPHLFHDRLKQVVARFKRDRESSAIVFIDLVNYARIKDYYGSAVAEQSLLRSVIKLRRLLRDVDTVSRIGEARFALILEGVTSRVAVTDRAARLIAAGLMPLTGLKPEVTLQFHIGAVLLEERALAADELVDSLDSLLANMSPRTRRPIRFLEPEPTEPAPLGPDSAIQEPDTTSPATVSAVLAATAESSLSQNATRH